MRHPLVSGRTTQKISEETFRPPVKILRAFREEPYSELESKESDQNPMKGEKLDNSGGDRERREHLEVVCFTSPGSMYTIQYHTMLFQRCLFHVAKGHRPSCPFSHFSIATLHILLSSCFSSTFFLLTLNYMNNFCSPKIFDFSSVTPFV